MAFQGGVVTPRAVAGWLGAALVAVLAAGCGRSFTPPKPGAKQLTAVATPSTVAPRAITVIGVAGGTQPYSVDLRPDNEHSGGDSRLDNNAITPGDGGSVVYFEYRAGSIGGVTDVITVSDSAGGHVDVQITVGQGLAISPDTQPRAPLQTQPFLVVGGQAPYTFSVTSTGSACDGQSQPTDGGEDTECVPADGGSGSCITGTGFYTARSCGGGEDVVRVVDATGTFKEAHVSVSSALSVAPLDFTLSPGEQGFIGVGGGVTPYTVAFADHGNRSDGTVDIAGNYVAGPNADVTDDIEVTDAVGATVRVHAHVGSPSIRLPDHSAAVAYTGDFNGDGQLDVAAVDLKQDLLTVEQGGGASLRSPRQVILPSSVSGAQVLVGDFNADGTDDLMFAATGSDPVVLTLLEGRRDGSFDVLPAVNIPYAQLQSKLVVLDGRTFDSSQVYAVGLSSSAATPPLDGGFTCVANAFVDAGDLCQPVDAGLILFCEDAGAFDDGGSELSCAPLYQDAGLDCQPAPELDAGETCTPNAAPPAPRQLAAIAVGPSGNLEILQHFDLPFTGDWYVEQVASASIPNVGAYVVVLHGADNQGNAACTVSGGGHGLQGYVLGFTADFYGTLQRDPDYDTAICVPVADDTEDTVQPFYFTHDQTVPDFLVTDGFGDPEKVQIHQPNGQTFTGWSYPADVATTYGAVYWTDYWGSDTNVQGAYSNYVPELDVQASKSVERWVFDPAQGFVQRPDSLPLKATSLVLTDFDGDSFFDAIVTTANSVELLRGTNGAHVGVGHDRFLRNFSYYAQAADLDGDGRDDVLAFDSNVRVFWGDPSGPAVGPQLLLGRIPQGMGRGVTGAWVATTDEDYNTFDVHHVQFTDAGLQDIAVPLLDPYFYVGIEHRLSPIHAGGTGPVGDVLITELDNSGDLTGYAGIVTANADGTGQQIADAYLPQSSVIAPVQFSGAPTDDLVVGLDDSSDFGSFGASVQLWPASPDATIPTLWKAQPSSSQTIEDGDGNFLHVTGVFPFASTPGGPLDMVFVTAAGVVVDANSGQSSCSNADPDGFGDDGITGTRTLFVFKTSGGNLTQVASLLAYDVENADPDNLQGGLSICSASRGWRVEAADLDGDGKNELLLTPRGIETNYAATVIVIPWSKSANPTPTSMQLDPYGMVDFAVGDFDGDHHLDVATSDAQDSAVRYFLQHPDGGGFY